MRVKCRTAGSNSDFADEIHFPHILHGEKPRNLVGFPGKEGLVSGKEKPPAHDGPGVGSSLFHRDFSGSVDASGLFQKGLFEVILEGFQFRLTNLCDWDGVMKLHLTEYHTLFEIGLF
jgi:hypothetical protein